MLYSSYYESPLGRLTLGSDGSNIIGLWISGQKYEGGKDPESFIEKSDLPVFQAAKSWLDAYFAGQKPDLADLPLAPEGSEFRQQVWKVLTKIPYGKVMTYGAIGQEVARRMGKLKMSGQAVGGAVGHNPISIIIPCHRVIGTNGSLTGYSGGINRKIKLLEHEGVDMSNMFVPKKGTAL